MESAPSTSALRLPQADVCRHTDRWPIRVSGAAPADLRRRAHRCRHRR